MKLIERKYKIRKDLTKNVNGVTLYRIEAAKSFTNSLRRDIKKGELGGWIEKEDNLSQEGECWLYDDVCVFGNAKVYDDAILTRNAMVYGNAKVYESALICGAAIVCDNAEVFGHTFVYEYGLVKDNAKVQGHASVSDKAIVSENAEVYGSAKVTNYAHVYGHAEVGGSAFLKDNAQVYGNAKINGNIFMYNDARVYGNANVDGEQHYCHSSCIRDNGQVYDNAKIEGYIFISDNGKVYGDADISGVSKVTDNGQVSGTANLFCVEIKENGNIAHSLVKHKIVSEDYDVVLHKEKLEKERYDRETDEYLRKQQERFDKKVKAWSTIDPNLPINEWGKKADEIEKRIANGEECDEEWLKKLNSRGHSSCCCSCGC